MKWYSYFLLEGRAWSEYEYRKQIWKLMPPQAMEAYPTPLRPVNVKTDKPCRADTHA
jgi:hypothetical protein